MGPSWRAPGYGVVLSRYVRVPVRAAYGVVLVVRTPVVRAPGARLPCHSGGDGFGGPARAPGARWGFRSGADYLRLGRLPLAVLRAAGLPVRAERRFS